MRGEDTYLLQTSPEYVIFPFNLKPKNLLFSALDENLSKHGFYIRVLLLLSFENLINGLILTDFKQDIENKNLRGFINLIVNLIKKKSYTQLT